MTVQVIRLHTSPFGGPPCQRLVDIKFRADVQPSNYERLVDFDAICRKHSRRAEQSTATRLLLEAWLNLPAMIEQRQEEALKAIQDAGLGEAYEELVEQCHLPCYAVPRS